MDNKKYTLIVVIIILTIGTILDCSQKSAKETKHHADNALHNKNANSQDTIANTAQGYFFSTARNIK